MTIPSTSPEHIVDTLMTQSNAIHRAIDPFFDGEPRHRRMLRVANNSTAIGLREGRTFEQVGGTLLRLPNIHVNKKGPLDTLSNNYADVERATLDRDGNFETDSRHAIHLLKLSTAYAREFHPELDINKIAIYALIHDILEAYAGDVPSLGMSPKQEEQKHFAEAQALITLRQEYGIQWPEFVAFVEEYESLADPEARFVKTFDKLDPGFTHFYNNGIQLRSYYDLNEDTFYRAYDETTARMSRYAEEYPQLMNVRAELTHRVAEVTFNKRAAQVSLKAALSLDPIT